MLVNLWWMNEFSSAISNRSWDASKSMLWFSGTRIKYLAPLKFILELFSFLIRDNYFVSFAVSLCERSAYLRSSRPHRTKVLQTKVFSIETKPKMNVFSLADWDDEWTTKTFIRSYFSPHLNGDDFVNHNMMATMATIIFCLISPFACCLLCILYHQSAC